VWWIVAAIVVFALLLSVLVAMVFVSRLRELRHVERALTRRAEQAAQLEEPVRALQERAEALQEQVAGVQRWLEARAARQAAKHA
jgi:uncharacterized protein YlxW (UPF0749 family)